MIVNVIANLHDIKHWHSNCYRKFEKIPKRDPNQTTQTTFTIGSGS